jgi:hypothetical protein
MMRLETPPSWVVSLFTLGIARARWIAEANRRLGQGGAGFWFAWLLLPFANYGLAQRMTAALREAGSSFTVSAFWCFWLTGWPLIGSAKRLKHGTRALNDAYSVRQLVEAPSIA